MSKKRKNRRKRQSFLLTLILFLLCIVTIWILCISATHFYNRMLGDHHVVRNQNKETESELIIPIEEETQKETETETETETEDETETETESYLPMPEVSRRYIFFQGPKAWSMRLPYSGSWALKDLAGSNFSIFGCGMCCMANIYSTFTDYCCSPLDMYDYALEVSDYSPGGDYCAIAWQFMQKTLNTAGFRCHLYNKDVLFKDFVDHISNAWCSIILVSCYNDDTYWKTTEGHYVTIWDYDPEDETVFLCDSGDPDHNGQRIPILYAFNALKTENEYQYMTVTGYEEEKNTWKHDGITDEWADPDRPETLVPETKKES